MPNFAEQIMLAGDTIRKKFGDDFSTAIILGSGLSAAFDDAAGEIMDYADVPGLIKPSVISHTGQLQISRIANTKVALCLGRLHLYEGYTAQQVAFLVYVLQQLGVKRLVVTNAAGALNSSYRPGDIMVIEDHINTTGHNPVIGQDDSLGQRFSDMSRAYPQTLAAEAMRIGCNLGLPMHLGIYAGVLGPTLETSAERRMLRTLGGDAVGMSTIMEVIAANHCGMQVLGLSAITNMATGSPNQKADTIEEVLHHAAVAGKGIRAIIENLSA